MGKQVGNSGTRAARGRALLRTALLGTALGLSASSCWFGGGQDPDEIDPDEATAREATFRSDAEKGRDARFSDRLQRRTRLDQPVR